MAPAGLRRIIAPSGECPKAALAWAGVRFLAAAAKIRELLDFPKTRFPWRVNVVVNGHPRQVRDGITVAELLAELELPRRGIAVEVNETLIPRTGHAEQTLHDGDRFEVVSLVGGG